MAPRKYTLNLQYNRIKTFASSFSKRVVIDSSRFKKNELSKDRIEAALHSNLPVTQSGRCIGDVLSISCPSGLYAVDNIQENGWGDPVVVISKTEPGEIATLVMCNEALDKKVMEHTERMERLDRDMKSLKEFKEKAEDDARHLMGWQLATQALDALAPYAWNRVSSTDKETLSSQCDIFDFSSFYKAQSSDRQDLATRTARSIYHRSVAWDLRTTVDFLYKKRGRTNIAHPDLPKQEVQKFISELSQHLSKNRIGPQEMVLRKRLVTYIENNL